ncbi:aspartate-semialdehyde dehydrogenase [bacterium]|nr:aspartate-semialdehyde dehydrogenase [bacterium]
MSYKVTLVGATGAVGREMAAVLAQRGFPVGELRMLASARSAGKTLSWNGREIVVANLDEADFSRGEIVLSSAGGKVSKVFAPRAAAAGAVVIDNTSAFRMVPDVPLVVPEVNPHAAKNHHGIIANPNCSTIQMVVALQPLHAYGRLTRIIVSTYQAVSGAGARAMEELTRETRAHLSGAAPAHDVFPHPIPFNVLPHIGGFLPNGYTEEEMKMVNETRKIMEVPDLAVTATTVRIPAYRGHSESIYIETEKKISADLARQLLSRAPGVVVMDDPTNQLYPQPIIAAGRDETFVGRIREDLSRPTGLNLWCVSDNLRKGAALNAVQIAELLAEKGWLPRG